MSPSVLVTGSSRGVGRGLVAAFASAGWDVAVTSRDPQTADAVAAELAGRGGRTVAAAVDVTVPGSVETGIDEAVRAFGGLDALVHNAVSTRSNEPVDLERTPPEAWDEHAAVALRGTWRCARAAFEPLRARAGALLVLTSPAGIGGSADLSLYAAVKGGQLAFVRSLAREWAPLGVRVNGLAPLARTDALEAAFTRDPEREARITGLVPTGRLGDPEHDVGPAAVFLCGAGAGYVTGQNLVVSGGRLTSA